MKSQEMREFENSLWKSGFYKRFIEVFEENLRQLEISSEKEM